MQSEMVLLAVCMGPGLHCTASCKPHLPSHPDRPESLLDCYSLLTPILQLNFLRRQIFLRLILKRVSVRFFLMNLFQHRKQLICMTKWWSLLKISDSSIILRKKIASYSLCQFVDFRLCNLWPFAEIYQQCRHFITFVLLFFFYCVLARVTQNCANDWTAL